MTHHIDLDTIVLDKGAHAGPDDGMCLMEATAYFAGEPWSDHPACVSLVIAAFGRRWNDDLDNEGRQRLKHYIPRLVGTATGEADDEVRAWMVTDWMVRTYMPAWLRLAKLDTQAAAVESLPELVGRDSWTAAAGVVKAAKTKAAAAGAAAWAAAWDAAGAAAWAAAWDAAGAAARAAAGAAARAAAGDAAWDAAGAAAWDAAWDAAGAAAWDAARAAAWDAARAALRPTVVGLQSSALDLLDRMIAVGQS